MCVENSIFFFLFISVVFFSNIFLLSVNDDLLKDEKSFNNDNLLRFILNVIEFLTLKIIDFNFIMSR